MVYYEPIMGNVETTIAEIQSLLEGELPQKAVLHKYKPANEWFLRGPNGVHGITHQARVLVNQEVLSSLVESDVPKKLDHEALRWAASTHDLRRMDDGVDRRHGIRAATWVEEEIRASIPATSLETTLYLNTWHVPHDSSAPMMTSELAIFKDADALDRGRLEELYPGVLSFVDTRQLRHKVSKELLLLPSQALYEKTAVYPTDEGFEYVLYTAEKLGLLR